MIRIDKATNQIWIEAKSEDDYMACHHATFILTEKIQKLVCDLKAIADLYKDRFDYLSLHLNCEVEFFEYDDSDEAIPIEGLTLHVDRFTYWFSAWVKNTGFSVETSPCEQVSAFTTEPLFGND